MKPIHSHRPMAGIFGPRHRQLRSPCSRIPSVPPAETAPWLALWPGLCLILTVYSLNMFGDAVRDLLDPHAK